MSGYLRAIAGLNKREARPDMVVPCSKCGDSIGVHLVSGATVNERNYVCGLCEWAELHPEEGDTGRWRG